MKGLLFTSIIQTIVCRLKGDVFVTKFNEDGSIAYSTLLGGAGVDVPVGIQVDSADFVYIAGTTSSNDFPLTKSPLLNTPGSGFIAKINPTGSVLAFSTYHPYAISAFAIDASGSAYLAFDGYVSTSVAPIIQDALLSKISAAGDRLVYTSDLGIWDGSFSSSVAVDSRGRAWVARAMLYQVAPDGSSVTIATNVPPLDASYVAVDSSDDVVITGYFHGQLNTTPNAALASPCSTNQVIIEFTADGEVVYASYLRLMPLEPHLWLSAPGQVLLDLTTRLDLTVKPSMNFACPVNGASFAQGQVSVGEIVSLFGYGLGPEIGVAARLEELGYVPTTLAGVQVLADGVPAPILYAQYGQVNLVMPAHKVTLTLQVRYNSQSAPLLDIPAGPNGAGVFAVLNQNGSLNSPSSPAAPGSTIQTFLTGLNISYNGGGPAAILPADGTIIPLKPLIPIYPPGITLGTAPAEIAWSGLAPGLVLGIEQVNIQIPQGILGAAASASIPLTYVGATVNIAVAK